MAILFLAPAEGWKGPSGPAGNLWPHLIYSSLERFRKFLEKKVTDRQMHARTHEAAFNLRREHLDGLRPSSFSLLWRAGRALRALLGTSGPILFIAV